MRIIFVATRHFLRKVAVNVICLPLLFATSPTARASNELTQGPLNNIACSRLLGGSYASSARKLGLEFLMVTMRPDRFVSLMRSAQNSRPIFRASGIGVQDLGERYDHSMKPLLINDVGKWAHQLIGGRGDAIGMGVRSKMVDQWEVGLIFPVEILDHIPFTITSTRTLRDRQLRVGTGLGGELFNSERENASEQFEDILRDEMTNPPYQDSYNFIDYFQIHFENGVPLEFVALYWVPAPLVKAFGSDRLPGVNSPLVPEAGQPFHVTISIQTPGMGRGWTDVRPPVENLFEFFDPKLRVGTWFNVIPDWRVVRTELEKSKQPAIPMLEYKWSPKVGQPKQIRNTKYKSTKHRHR